jgi:hypothetical protein
MYHIQRSSSANQCTALLVLWVGVPRLVTRSVEPSGLSMVTESTVLSWMVYRSVAVLVVASQATLSLVHRLGIVSVLASRVLVSSVHQ